MNEKSRHTCDGFLICLLLHHIPCGDGFPVGHGLDEINALGVPRQVDLYGLRRRNAWHLYLHQIYEELAVSKIYQIKTILIYSYF